MNTIWQPTLEGRDGPKYRAVVDAIREATADGTLPVGQKLPPVRDLAWQLSITPGTVARAYTILTEEGVLESHVGRGTFVAAPKSQMQEDIWSRSLRRLEATDPGHVSLFAPRLADMGQVALIREAMGVVLRTAKGPAVMQGPEHRSTQPADSLHREEFILQPMEME